ncbi:MAG: LptF/LptG family permease [Gemmatimonadaceae bacterium]
MKILQRYIIREHVGPLVFALAALTSLLLLNQVAKQFGNLVGKGLSWGVIGEFFLLSIPFIIAMTLPMAVLVSTLYAFSRLAAENEITALKASGIGLSRLIRPVLYGAAVISAIMMTFNDQILPRANHRLRTLQSDIGRKKPTFALKEQVINEVSPGRLFLRAGRIEESSDALREITIYDMTDPGRRRTIYADSGRMALASNLQDLEMTLFSGYSQEIPRANSTELQRLYYTVDLIRVRGVANGFERDTNDAYKSDREMSICEMQRAVGQSATEVSRARTELADVLANATHRVATGATLRNAPKSALARQPGLSIGTAYCRYVLPVFATKPALAAEPADAAPPALALAQGTPTPEGTQTPQAPRPPRGAAPVPGSGMAANPALLPRGLRRMPRGVDSARAAAATAAGLAAPSPVIAPAANFVTQPVETFASVIAQADVMRSRITDARESMSRYEVEIQKKFALSAACVVFVLLGAPIALRFPRGGVGLVIGVSLGVFALYYVGLIMGETLADKLILSPFVAMWLANVIFTLVGLYFLWLVRKTGATARGGDMSEMWDSMRSWLAQRARAVGIHLDRRHRAPST